MVVAPEKIPPKMMIGVIRGMTARRHARQTSAAVTRSVARGQFPRRALTLMSSIRPAAMTNAGKKACDEHLGDGDVDQGAEDDHVDAGGNENPHGGRGAEDGGGLLGRSSRCAS